MPTSEILDFHDLFADSGLRTATPQVWNTLRLVPIISQRFRSDLRLSRRVYQDFVSIVELPDDIEYWSYIPHSYILNWNPDGEPEVSLQTQLGNESKRWKQAPIRSFQRMAKKDPSQRQMRFLPLHLALEGYLAQFFNAPKVDWRDDYLRQAMRQGLSPRSATMAPGIAIEGLEEALRVFELHPNQVGLLFFVAEALASVMIYPHPSDYRLLHRSILADFFGEVLAWYHSRLPYRAASFDLAVYTQAQSWSDLRQALHQLDRENDTFQRYMASGVLGQKIAIQQVQNLGPYTLSRFMTPMDGETQDAHIGELILGTDQRLAYLKTCGLNREQIRQARYLALLDQHDWHIELAAKSLNMSKDQLILKLDQCGLGQLLQPKLIDQAKKRLREGDRQAD